MRLLFVTMFTDLYRGEVDQLLDDFKGTELEILPVHIESRGSWIANVQQKAQVVLDALTGYQCPVVWLDADARIRKHPSVLLRMEEHVGFAAYFIPNVFKIAAKRPWGPHRGKDALAGGTMYFNYSEPTHDLVKRWVELCEQKPTRWEQQNLQEALGQKLDDSSIFHVDLPQSYCKVFDRKWYPGEGGPIVIEHMQASRRLRKKVT